MPKRSPWVANSQEVSRKVLVCWCILPCVAVATFVHTNFCTGGAQWGQCVMVRHQQGEQQHHQPHLQRHQRHQQQCPAGTRTRPATWHFFRYPTRFSFGNHRVAGNPKHWVLPDISVKPEVSGITRYFGYHDNHDNTIIR